MQNYATHQEIGIGREHLQKVSCQVYKIGPKYKIKPNQQGPDRTTQQAGKKDA